MQMSLREGFCSICLQVVDAFRLLTAAFHDLESAHLEFT